MGRNAGPEEILRDIVGEIRVPKEPFRPELFSLICELAYFSRSVLSHSFGEVWRCRPWEALERMSGCGSRLSYNNRLDAIGNTWLAMGI